MNVFFNVLSKIKDNIWIYLNIDHINFLRVELV